MSTPLSRVLAQGVRMSATPLKQARRRLISQGPRCESSQARLDTRPARVTRDPTRSRCASLCDLERGEVADRSEWAEAAAFAARINATEAFTTGLRLVPDGMALAPALGLPPKASTETMLRSQTPPHTSLAIMRFAQVNWRERITIALDAAPARTFMRDWRPGVWSRPACLPSPTSTARSGSPGGRRAATSPGAARRRSPRRHGAALMGSAEPLSACGPQVSGSYGRGESGPIERGYRTTGLQTGSGGPELKQRRPPSSTHAWPSCASSLTSVGAGAEHEHGAGPHPSELPVQRDAPSRHGPSLPRERRAGGAARRSPPAWGPAGTFRRGASRGRGPAGRW